MFYLFSSERVNMKDYTQTTALDPRLSVLMGISDKPEYNLSTELSL